MNKAIRSYDFAQVNLGSGKFVELGSLVSPVILREDDRDIINDSLTILDVGPLSVDARLGVTVMTSGDLDWQLFQLEMSAAGFVELSTPGEPFITTVFEMVANVPFKLYSKVLRATGAETMSWINGVPGTLSGTWDTVRIASPTNPVTYRLKAWAR